MSILDDTPLYATAQDGTRLAYRALGQGPQHVLLVHGWMTTAGVWDPVARALAAPTRRVVVMSLRGAGGAPFEPDFSLPTMADDVLCVAAAAGLKDVTLVGHSMGGQLAQLAAARRPSEVAALVLLNPVPARGLTLLAQFLELFSTSARDAAKQGAILDMATLALAPAARERLVELAGTLDDATIRGGLDAWCGGGFEDQLGAIRARTLVVSTDDPFLPPALLDECVTSRIEGARRVHVGGAGHYPSVEAPDETLRVVQAFLADS